MKPIVKWAALSTSVIVAIAGMGYGGWWAWDNGKVGHNPRAISAAAMAQAVQRQTHILSARHDQGPQCININLHNPRPEIDGLPGIAPRAYPGQHAWTLMAQSNLREQPARYHQILRLNFLTSQGFLKAENIEVDTDAGPQAATRYVLTWEAYKMFRQDSGGQSGCLYFGQRKPGEISQIEKVADRLGDFDVYEATVDTQVEDVPAWARHPDAKSNFPELAEALAPRTEKIRVVRTQEGWRSMMELQTELMLSMSGKDRDVLALRQQMASMFQTPAAISTEMARELVAQQQNNPQWIARHGVACLPLRLQRGGDDPAARNLRDQDNYTVLVQDRDDRKDHEYRNLSHQLHVLSALKAVGFAEVEVLRPQAATARARTKPPAAPAPAAQATPPLQDLPGLRFRIHPAAVSAFGLTGGSACVPAGRVSIEVLAVRPENSHARVLARGTIAQTPDWAMNLSAHMPALKSMLDHGVPFRTMLTPPSALASSPDWRVSEMTPAYPEPLYSGMPAELAALLPRTASAMPRAPGIKAPALVQQSDANIQAMRNATVAASTSGAAVAAGHPAATAQPQRSPPPTVSPAGRTAPFAAGHAPVHVVSIYQGMDRPGTPQPKLGDPPPDPPLEGVMNVTVSVPDALVLLFAHEPVEWRVKVTAGTTTPRIIAIGAHKQRITLTGLGRATTNALDMNQLWQHTGEVPSIPSYNGGRNDMVQIGEISRLITGQSPASFQTQPADHKQPRLAEFNISPQTVRFELPAARSPRGNGTPIVLRGSSREEVRDYVLYRGASGAYTNAWTDLAFSSGKGYYEATMRVTGSLSAHAHSNAGLCLARETYTESDPRTRAMVMRSGQEKLHKDGDLFGIAVDFDRQRMYFRVNGNWIDGEPGSEGGIRLHKDKEYRACAFAAGTVTGDVKRGKPQSDTHWEMNFGQKPFRHPPPANYLALGGG